MLTLIHLFLLSISVLSQQNLSPINRCMGNCMICDPNQLSLCSGQQYVQCVKGYDGKGCEIKHTYLEQLRFIDADSEAVDKKNWEISSTAFCYYNNSKGQSKKIQVLGIYNQFQSNKLSFAVKPWYQSYQIQFTLIRTSWTPYSDLLRVASFDQDQNQLNQYFIEYQKRDQIHLDKDRMRCKNLPYLVEKFLFQGKFEDGQNKMVVQFEGMMFSQSQWAISDLRVAVGCSNFLTFDGTACQACHKGYYPILNMHSDIQRCIPCPIQCQQCSQSSRCSQCIQGYSVVQNKCTSKNPTKAHPSPNKTFECAQHKLHKSQQFLKQKVGKIQQIEYSIPIQVKHTQLKVMFNLYYAQSDRQNIMGGNVKVYVDGALIMEVIGEDLLYGSSGGYVVDRCQGFGQAGVFSIFKVVVNTIQHNSTQANFKIEAIGIQAIAVQDIHIQYVYRQPIKDSKKLNNTNNQGNKQQQKQKQKVVNNKPSSQDLEKNNNANKNQQKNDENRGINTIQETNKKQNPADSQKSTRQTKNNDEKNIQENDVQKPNKSLQNIQKQKQNKITPQNQVKKQNRQELDQPIPKNRQNNNIRTNTLNAEQKQNTSNPNTTQQIGRKSNIADKNKDQNNDKNQSTHSDKNQSQNNIMNNSKKQQNQPIPKQKSVQETPANKDGQQLQPIQPLSPVQTRTNKQPQQKSLYQSEILDHPSNKQAAKNINVQAQKNKQAKFGSSTAILPEQIKPKQINDKDRKQEQMQKINNTKNSLLPTPIIPAQPTPSVSENNLIKVSQVIGIIQKIKQKIIIGIKQSKQFILTITYPVELELEYFPSVSAYFKNINKTLIPEVIRQFNNYHYQELAFNLNTSLLDETISIQLIKPNNTNSSNNSSTDNKSKPGNSTTNSSQNKQARLLQQSLNNVQLAQINIPRYDYLSDDEWNSINRFSIFFQIIAWFAIISTIILTLLGNSVVTQKFVLLLQMTFLHVYIYSQYLPINFKVTISGMQRIENLDYFADNSSLSNSIQYSLLGNMIQFSPSRFTMFNKDINFTRAIYPTIIINLVYLIWYLILYLIKWKIQPNFILSDYQQCSKIKKLKFHIIRIAERPMNFWYQVWQYQYIVFIWTACIQIYNFSYPNSRDNTYIANFVFSSLCLLVTLLLPSLTFLYLNKKYFRLDYFEYSYWYHNIFFLQIPEENLPSQHHRVLIIVRNFRYIILVVMIAFLGNQPLICLPILIVTNLLSLVYTKLAGIQIKPFNSKLNIIEHILLILLSISIIVAYTTSKVLSTESYLIIGNIIITVCLLIVLIGLVRVAYYLYHKINDGVRDNQYNNYKPPIQTIKTL